MPSKLSLYLRWGLVTFLGAVFGISGMTLPAYAACTNPATIPTGFAAPCPVFSPSAASAPQSGTLTFTATPQAGTDYILTTAYISNGTTWNPYTLIGNNAVPNYSSSLASLTLSAAQLSTLGIGTHYAVSWDWLWDGAAQCYKGPGLNQCNTGTWRVQSFAITATYAYSQSSYHAYSQSSYYAYSQSAYYAYSQATYTTGRTYYVSPTGNDANSGSASAPWRTINHAATIAAAGDTVHVLPGNYAEAVQMAGNSGTSGARITFISDTKWGALVTGNGSTAPAWQIRSASYVDVVNFEITNSTGYMGIEMLAIGDRAIGNLIHDVPGGCTLGQLTLGGAGINMAAFTSTYDQEAIGNYIHDIGDPFNPHGCALTHGVYVENGAIPQAGHFSSKVQNNIVYRVESDGITSWHCATTMIVSNNTVFEAGSSGILVGATDGCTNANSTIDNNIAVHNGYHADCTYTDLTQCPNGKGVHLGNGGIVENDGSEANNLLKNNLLYNNQRAGAVNDTILLKVGSGSLQSGTISGVNPLFVTYTIEADVFPGTRLSSGDLHLQAGSPAINTGAGNVTASCASSSGFTSCVPTIDYDGVARPQGTGYDIGAYEYH